MWYFCDYKDITLLDNQEKMSDKLHVWNDNSKNEMTKSTKQSDHNRTLSGLFPCKYIFVLYAT